MNERGPSSDAVVLLLILLGRSVEIRLGALRETRTHTHTHTRTCTIFGSTKLSHNQTRILNPHLLRPPPHFSSPNSRHSDRNKKKKHAFFPRHARNPNQRATVTSQANHFLPFNDTEGTKGSDVAGPSFLSLKNLDCSCLSRQDLLLLCRVAFFSGCVGDDGNDDENGSHWDGTVAVHGVTAAQFFIFLSTSQCVLHECLSKAHTENKV